jgi:hypothetical protein
MDIKQEFVSEFSRRMRAKAEAAGRVNATAEAC